MKYMFLGLTLLVSVGCASSTFYYEEGKKKTLTPVQTQLRSNDDIDYYMTENNNKVGVSDTLLVKFSNTKNLTAYENEFSIKKVKEVVKNLYLFKVSDKSLTIKISNELYKKDDVEYAHPNFYKQKVDRWEFYYQFLLFFY